ncbi:tetratricopeptide repeat protein [Vibrio profundum]|uniref:tetratricopeptide repeat protein n=1 Tax=Vibrio profundum TaxID=2910247 RepID=UPI003D0B0E51
MPRLRWTLLLLASLLIFPAWADSTPRYGSPVLEEAHQLLGFLPQQSKKLTENFLYQRTLADMTVRNLSPLPRNTVEGNIRTPSSSIDALQILARAEFTLHQYPQAFLQLQQAKDLAQKYHLMFSGLLVQIQDIHLRWLYDHDLDKAEKRLSTVQIQLDTLNKKDPLSHRTFFEYYKLKAELAAANGQLDEAKLNYDKLKSITDNDDSEYTTIDYHMLVGRYLLKHHFYNRALSDLLTAYWQAIEVNASVRLAAINQSLGELFYQRGVLDKAIEHLSQAADFYNNYQNSPVLPEILKKLGDIYLFQGKYNLALVQYFNVIDHENMHSDPKQIAEVRLSVADTYLKLDNYLLAKRYLEHAKTIIKHTPPHPYLTAKAQLLSAGLSYHYRHPNRVITSATMALAQAKKTSEEQKIDLEKSAYNLLYLAYQDNGKFEKALDNLKKYNQINKLKQRELNLISEDDFRQQKQFIEQTLHLVSQKKELEKTYDDYQTFQKIAFGLFSLSVILSLFALRNSYVSHKQKNQIEELSEDLFAHSRSGLRNLRMLNASLPKSLAHSSHKFEKWHIGELIHEPLNDRLRFVMIDLPFLSNMYLQHGYSEGLALEGKFGDYLKSVIPSPARLYHFSDASLLYIENSSGNPVTSEQMFTKVQQWVNDFEPELNLTRIVRVGMTDYPFLPRAYTAINDKQLLDILLMASNLARDLSWKENSSQWVHFQAIKNAPAASLAQGNLRSACQQAIRQGLIKVHSSCQNEEHIKDLLKDI